MKTKIILIIAFILFAKIMKAQGAIDCVPEKKLQHRFLSRKDLASMNTFKLGVKTGVNLSKYHQYIEDGSIRTQYLKTGFHVGLVADYSFNRKISLQPELFIIMNGSKMYIQTRSGDDINKNVFLEQLQLPVNFKLKLEHFYLKAGPYVGMAVAGTTRTDKYVEKSTGYIKGGDWPLYEGTGNKRFDFGASLGLGYEFPHIIISVAYQIGIADLNSRTSNNLRLNSGLLSIGYLF